MRNTTAPHGAAAALVSPVVVSTARYDGFADWYERWAGDGPSLIADHADLLGPVDGTRLLDVACGLGRLSRDLADRGGLVVGLDLSEAMLDKARSARTPRIDYVQG